MVFNIRWPTNTSTVLLFNFKEPSVSCLSHKKDFLPHGKIQKLAKKVVLAERIVGILFPNKTFAENNRFLVDIYSKSGWILMAITM